MANRRAQPKATTSPADLAAYRTAALKNTSKFIQQELSIINADGELQKLAYNPTQIKLDQVYEEEVDKSGFARIITVKARRAGTSTWGAGRTAARAYLKDNSNCLTVAHLDWRTEQLFKMHHDFFDYMDQDLRMAILSDTKKSLVLANGSCLSCVTAGSIESGRGGGLHCLHLSEAAYYKDLERLLKAYNPSLVKRNGGFLVLESTANGTGNYFCELFMDAWRYPEGHPYRAIFLEWWTDERYQYYFNSPQERVDFMNTIAMRDEELKAKQAAFGWTAEQCLFWWTTLHADMADDREFMGQEYPTSPEEAFLASGRPFFSLEGLRKYNAAVQPGLLFDPTEDQPWKHLADMQQKPDIKRNEQPYLEIWYPPQQGRRYLISADCGRGKTHGDYSAAYVFDVDAMAVCAHLHGHIEPTPFARQLAKLGTFYNNADVAPEIDGPGLAVLEVIKSIYMFLYHWHNFKSNHWEVTGVAGWATNNKSRDTMMNRADEHFKARMGDHFLIPDAELVGEMQTFVLIDGKYQAAPNKFDDRVMAWMIGVMICCQYNEKGGTSMKVLRPPESGILLPSGHTAFVHPRQVRKNLANMLGLRSFDDVQKQNQGRSW